MHNYLNIADIHTMPLRDIAALSPVVLRAALKESEEIARKARWSNDWIQGALYIKYASHIRKRREEEEDVFSPVILNDEGCKITCETQKDVSWNKDALLILAEKLQERGFDPNAYLDIRYSIREHLLALLPEDLRTMAEAARITKPGISSFKIRLKIGGVL